MNYYNEIKQELINNEINRKVKEYSINRSDLNTYYNVGKLIIAAQGGEARAKYGNQLIKEYSKKLSHELGSGYSERSLKDMRKFFLFIKKGHAVHAQLSWNHYKKLFSINDDNKIEFYIREIMNEHLSYRELTKRIKSKEYERLPESTKNKLINKEDISIEDNIKNPIIIKNNSNEEINEKILQRLILEDITNFMKELGNGYSFIDNEYKIKVGDRYNYIDILLYNIEFNCYVVVELKVTELKKEHIGQIEVYMNYIDTNLKKITQNKTIGIIICRKNNEYIIEYCSDKRILSREYELI
ncbi:MAG: DUF1016 family protein [Bacilli bacterium]|nr:DUF1016 family protein [Bacilli bacterium]